jgi:hypothetical protein
MDIIWPLILPLLYVFKLCRRIISFGHRCLQLTNYLARQTVQNFKIDISRNASDLATVKNPVTFSFTLQVTGKQLSSRRPVILFFAFTPLHIQL